MQPVVQRVRGVMSLLLIWALLLLWVASIQPVDVHRLCLDLEIDWSQLWIAAKNGGVVPEPSLARPAEVLRTTEEAELLQRFTQQWEPLAKLRYSSLNANHDWRLRASAVDYVAACEQALKVAVEGEQLGHGGFSSEVSRQLIAKLDRQVATLAWHVERLDLGPAATLEDVAREARPRIAIPGSGQTLPMAGAVALSSVGLPCLYLYLVSLLRALREAIDQQEVRNNGDWIFFHPGWLGPVLGLVWLSLPLAALYLAGATVFSVQAVNSVSRIATPALLVLPLAWAWCIVAALRTRHRAMREPEQVAQSTSIAERRLDTYTDAGITLEKHRRAA